MSVEKPLPKFGEWDVNDPTSAEDFTAIFSKARDEKKSGGKTDSPSKEESSSLKHAVELRKPQRNGFAVCNLLMQNPEAAEPVTYCCYKSTLTYSEKTGAVYLSCDGSCCNFFALR
ncbi:hypothetical protein Ancab_010780 [Ancistrocladus abbreviatus]